MASHGITTTRRLVAQRQIHAAIVHLRDHEFECAITLAAAAEGRLSGAPGLLERLRGVADDLDYNAFINWLKHDKPHPEEVGIDTFEVTVTIIRAVSKFTSNYETMTPEMSEFLGWARENKYFPFKREAPAPN